jgi:hypothetical protein
MVQLPCESVVFRIAGQLVMRFRVQKMSLALPPHDKRKKVGSGKRLAVYWLAEVAEKVGNRIGAAG